MPVQTILAETAAPDATLALTRECPHCPAMLQILSDLVKQGRLGRLEVVNLNQHPDWAAERGIRSVPWLRIGPFELTGVRDRAEVEHWIARAGSAEGMADYFHTLLKEGELAKVEATLRDHPEWLGSLLPIVANPEASLNVRIGAGAVMEGWSGAAALAALIPELGELSRHADARVRADASYYLGLTRDARAGALLQKGLDDPDPDVREIAREGLDSLGSPES